MPNIYKVSGLLFDYQIIRTLFLKFVKCFKEKIYIFLNVSIECTFI